ncbi:Uncharacterised protein [Mycobacteroides abscessus subsp. abscessus]|nr:Uncharacterised protein [Mycobacteroides abscessus subsp. abscessus]
MLVDHASHTTVGIACHHGVADSQRSALDQHCRHRSATAVEVRLDGDTLSVHVGVGTQIERRVGSQQHRFEQLLDVGALLGRDVDEHRVAAVLLGDQPVFGELAADLRRIGAFLVDLVDRDHDRHICCLRVVHGLHRLRHDAVVGGDHEDRDVGRLGTTGTHGGERLVTRGVDERDQSIVAVEVRIHLVGTDVLGDATGLALTHVLLTDGVEQAGLAVVDVTHDGDHRRTLFEILFAALVLAVGEIEALEELAIFVLRADDLDVVVHLGAEQLQRLVVDRLGRRDHLAEVEQRLDQRCRVGVDLVGEVGQRSAAGETNRLTVAARQPDATDGRSLHRVVLLPLLTLGLATLAGCTTWTSERTGCAATTATAATGASAETSGRTSRCSGGRASAATAIASATAATATARSAAAAWSACVGTCRTTGHGTRVRARGHVARVRARSALTRCGTCSGTAGTGAPCTLTWSALCGTSTTRAGTALTGSGTWCRRARSWCGSRRIRIVSDARRTRTGLGPGTWTRRRRRGSLSCRGRRLLCRRRGGRGGRCRGGCRRGRWCRLCGGRRRCWCRFRSRRLGAGASCAGLGRSRVVTSRGTRLGCCRLRGVVLGCSPVSCGEGFAESAGHGGLDGRRRGFDELALFFETFEHLLARHAKFLGQFMHAGFACHCSPHLEAERLARHGLGLRPIRAHRGDFTVCSCLLLPVLAR